MSHLKYDVSVSNSADAIRAATHVILPGVGAFGAAMERIRSAIPLDVLESEVLGNKKAFLGICVGMQVLAERGFEHGENEGLGWIKGNVKKLPAKNLPLPHIGWNDLELKGASPLFRNFASVRDLYFVHSYALDPVDGDVTIAEADYGGRFCAAVQQGNIFGVQFHPEKSQKAGQVLLHNFLQS